MRDATTEGQSRSSAAQNSGAVKKNPPQAPVAARQHDGWWFAAATVLVGSCILRLLFPDLKPLHHDEGVNGLFMMNLFRSGFYHYDPANYHGPTLYYFGLITTTLNALFYGRAGLSTFAIRLVPAIFGIALVWLGFSLRRYLGSFGALAAAALLAASPGMVYFSRYFIHEIPFVFLTLALVVMVLRYRETSRPRYLMLASGSAALLFATKETCIITFAVLLLAWLCTRVYLSIRNIPPAPETNAASADTSPGKDRWGLWAIAALLFVAISVLFFSSFFTNFPQGAYDSVRAFKIWAQTGQHTAQYRAPVWTYFLWLEKEELPILLLGGLGIVIALWRAHNRFAVFAAFWAIGITAAYSLLPYKTPWLALNLILPLAIMAGYFLNECYGTAGLRRVSAALVLLAAFAVSLYQAIDLSFFRYTDDSIPYVYAHTSPQLLDLVKEVETIAGHAPFGKQIGIAIVSSEYWPLPWYLRDYQRALFWGHMVSTSEPLLIASGLQIDEVERDLGRYYKAYKAYDLRPGNVLVLYLRRDIQP
ncbi:MAG TPA: flippase activity-associated protein Agl23 [Candidatus Angelobacter sp.]|nr:flippase activity-associated protein Agl23 [Candidatus Angelobacter sp.]